MNNSIIEFACYDDCNDDEHTMCPSCGEIVHEDDYDWEDDYGYNFEGEVEVDDADEEQKKAQTIADKIEWNKKLVDRLSEKGNSDGKIKERQERIDDLLKRMVPYR